MTPRHMILTGLLWLSVAFAAPAALAAPPIGLPLRFGLLAGVHLTSPEFDVLGIRERAAQPLTAGLFGLRLGWRASRAVGLELGAALAPAGTVGGGDALLLPLHLDLTLRPLATTVAPYAAIGGGLYALVAGDSGRDVDGLARVALGLEWSVDRGVALRVEAALLMSDGVSDALSLTPTISVGVDLLGWREGVAGEAAPPPEDAPALFVPTPADVGSGASGEDAVPDDDDRDDDGVDDDEDVCPEHAGLEALDGCPDTDADGLRDAFDRCPTRAGAAAQGGCPDADGDGVSDRWDACPRRAGTGARYGCP